MVAQVWKAFKAFYGRFFMNKSIDESVQKGMIKAFETLRDVEDISLLASDKVVGKVLLINGSPHSNGGTATALNEMNKTFETYNIETELVKVRLMKK